MTKYVLILGLAFIATGSFSAANATTFTGSAVGSWTNLQAAGTGNVYSIANNDVGGVASFSFGAGSPPNLFTFNGVGSDGAGGFSANAEQAFDIGHFTYYNGVTGSFPQFSNIDLAIALHLASPVNNNSNFLYDFGIDITPNTTGNPVLDGDIVSLANGITTTTFTVGSTIYTLALDGFSTNGGLSYKSQFLSPEQSTATADIYATITTQTLPVPEPGSIEIFGTAVIGLIIIVRRKQLRA